jgi:hypothetical protein
MALARAGLMGIYGQDWAGYQSPAPSVTGLSFVFLKATEGLTYVNPNYAAQLAYARLHKLTVGHYHYPHMANTPAAEADRFLAVAGISRPWLFHQYGASGVDKDYCPLSAAALKEFAHAKEKDMPLTQADIDKVVAAVWAKPMVSPTNKAQHSAETFLRYGDDHYARLAAAITAQQAPAAPIDYTALAKALLAEIKS